MVDARSFCGFLGFTYGILHKGSPASGELLNQNSGLYWVPDPFGEPLFGKGVGLKRAKLKLSDVEASCEVARDVGWGFGKLFRCFLLDVIFCLWPSSFQVTLAARSPQILQTPRPNPNYPPHALLMRQKPLHSREHKACTLVPSGFPLFAHSARSPMP